MLKNVSLKPYNSFGIDVKADWLAEISSEEQLLTIIDDLPNMKKLILGGGSNVLFLNDFDGIVLLNKIKGIKIVSEDENQVTIAVKGGENWHELVMWAVEKGYGGIENLALIPGNAGTAPIQNIGAYGVEVKDVIKEVHTINMKTCEPKIFSNDECHFAYRQSIFKLAENKNKYFINKIVIQLQKKAYQPNLNYGAIKTVLKEKKILSPTVKQIAEAIISIRESKLPDPKKIGNAGSFFKNPVIDKALFEKLLKTYPQMPYYILSENEIKIPAGWLIDNAGFKGKRFGNVGVHDKQALVLVNFGKGTGMDIKNLSDKIRQSIQNQYNIALQPEVNFI
jgi:UDP-N-acetylmuramate dehydrogenase